jgi:hypothetical protein
MRDGFMGRVPVPPPAAGELQLLPYVLVTQSDSACEPENTGSQKCGPSAIQLGEVSVHISPLI